MLFLIAINILQVIIKEKWEYGGPKGSCCCFQFGESVFAESI